MHLQKTWDLPVPCGVAPWVHVLSTVMLTITSRISFDHHQYHHHTSHSQLHKKRVMIFKQSTPSSLMIPNLQKSYLDRFPATQQAPLKPHDETTGNEHNHLDFLAVVAIPAHLPMERFASEDNFGPNYFESCHPSKMNNQKSKQIIGLGSSRGPGLRIKPQNIGESWWEHDIEERAPGAVGQCSTCFLSKSSKCSFGCF